MLWIPVFLCWSCSLTLCFLHSYHRAAISCTSSNNKIFISHYTLAEPFCPYTLIYSCIWQAVKTPQVSLFCNSSPIVFCCSAVFGKVFQILSVSFQITSWLWLIKELPDIWDYALLKSWLLRVLLLRVLLLRAPLLRAPLMRLPFGLRSW
jgi:hypothetical protein